MKRLIIYVTIIILLAGGWYVYKISTSKVKPLTEVETQAAISSAGLIEAFEKDSAAANKQYLGKIIEVTGPVKSVEVDVHSTTVVLGEDSTLSSVRCSMDTGFVKEAATLNRGQNITVKGACTGYNPDDMGLGADVVLNRCVIESKKNNQIE